jgi:hypothetical protein
MNCKAAFSGAALAAAAYAITPGASRSETVTIPSAGSDLQADPAPTGKGSGVPATANEAGFDRPATSDHPEGGVDSLAIGPSSAPDAMAPSSGGESGDNAPDAVSSVADPEPSTLTRLLIVFSDLRAQIFGGP